MRPAMNSLNDHIAWSYANLARAHSALEDGVDRYHTKHHVIRNKIYYGIRSGNLHFRSLYDDERVKLKYNGACCYCGSSDPLSLDHLLSRRLGGTDAPENLLPCCPSCNSSKGDKDLMVWFQKRQQFPGLLILRRYLKNVHRFCKEGEFLAEEMTSSRVATLPFRVDLLPHSFPPLSTLVFWPSTPRQPSAPVFS